MFTDNIFITCLQTIIVEYKTYIQTNNFYFRCLNAYQFYVPRAKNFIQINILGTYELFIYLFIIYKLFFFMNMNT